MYKTILRETDNKLLQFGYFIVDLQAGQTLLMLDESKFENLLFNGDDYYWNESTEEFQTSPVGSPGSP